MYRKILIIAPNLDSCKKLKYEINSKTISAYYETSVNGGKQHLARYECELIMMDIFPPNSTWLQSLKELHEMVAVPILVLTTSIKSKDIVDALSIADDYLQKPFDMEVCKAKVNALMRRPVADIQCPPCALSKDGNVIVLPRYRIVRVKDTEIQLPRIPFDLLYLMVFNEGRVFTREQLYHTVWGDEFENGENTLNCQISYLR